MYEIILYKEIIILKIYYHNQKKILNNKTNLLINYLKFFKTSINNNNNNKIKIKFQIKLIKKKLVLNPKFKMIYNKINYNNFNKMPKYLMNSSK